MKVLTHFGVAAASLLFAIAGCKKKPPAPGPATVKRTPAPTGAKKPPVTTDTGETGITGILSEAEFKKLHVLRKDQPPRLRGKMVSIGTAKAYMSLPPNQKAPMPALVVVHEWWGLNAHIKHWADRLAADGFAALAVDLYGGVAATTRDQAMALVKKLDRKAAVQTLLAAHRFLQEDARVKASKTGSIGWCLGGGYSLQLALNAVDLDAAVIYYGRLVTDPARLGKIKAQLLGIFGNKDRGIPPKVVDKFEAALKKAGVKHQILRFDANHAFANPSSGRYDAASARAAWTKVRAFFARNLKK